MAKKIIKKVDVKKVAKIEVSAQIKELFEGLGFEILDGADFGFTQGTQVLKSDKCDIQIKLITPKAGIDRYCKLDEEDEELEEIVEDVVPLPEVEEEGKDVISCEKEPETAEIV